VNRDPLQLNVLWSRLIAIVDEQAATLIRTAFTPVVAEAEDLAAGLFDAQGRMLAQSLTGTPGHILSLATSIERFLIAFQDDELVPGDVLICNDPWVTSGHANDIIVATPVFVPPAGPPETPAERSAAPAARLAGFLASTCHAIDIGGRGFGASARECYEEGLLIPFAKLYRAGQPNRDVFNFIRANVRLPDDVLGDLHAQVVANDTGARRLLELLAELGLAGIEELGDAVLDRTEAAVRRAIASLPPGTYRYELLTDGAEDPTEPLVYRLALTVEGDHLAVDYAGTSPQVATGINATFNYAMAYTVYPLVCALAPEVPFNAGVFRAITLRAPEGSIVNARRPAPVSARHLKNYAMATVTLGALSAAAPERVVAGSPPEWNLSLLGTGADGRPFVAAVFPAGGMGARAAADGISATCFPANVPAMSVEIVEAKWPLHFEHLSLRADSGGAGRHRGGNSESLALRVESPYPARLMCMYDGLVHPTPGLLGGGAGACGQIRRGSGRPVHPKQEIELEPGETVTFDLPGGGGFGETSPPAPPRRGEGSVLGRGHFPFPAGEG
jgi:N-methylhydantoinase B